MAKKAVQTYEKFEDRPELKKLCMYFVIVNFENGENIVKIFKNNCSSAQFLRVGEGTATEKIRDILSIEDNKKVIVYSIVSEDHVSEIKKEIEAYFAASKKNAGIAFTIDINSIVGVKVYKFLSQTVRG